MSPLPLSGAELKVTMALTGVVFVAYVFVHMLGNLKVFFGADDFNDYAAFLRRIGAPIIPHEWVLWSLRLVLLACLVGHVGSAAVIARRARAGASRAARVRRTAWWRSFTSRTMLVSGIVVGAFVVFHILDLTLGVAGTSSFRHPETAGGGEQQFYPYENLVASFERPAVAAFYILAMVVLCAHLLHGCWSVVNDLGVTGARTRQVLWVAGSVIALFVMVGNITIPVAVLAGWVD